MNGLFLLAALIASAAAQQKVYLGNVLPTTAALNTTLTMAAATAKAQYASLNTAAANFSVVAVNVTQLPISADVRLLLLDSEDNADVVESTTGRVTLSFSQRTNSLLNKAARANLFRLVPDESTEGTVLGDLAQRFGQSRVCVIYESGSTYGTAVLGTLRTRLAAQMVTIVREVEVRSVWDAAALQAALVSAQSVTVSNNKPSNVGTFVYVGNDGVVFEKVMNASAALNITGNPYLWLAGSVVSQLPAATLARPEYRGLVSLGYYGDVAALAYDAVFAAAAALDASYLSLDNATLIGQALAAVKFTGRSGVVAFDANRDRPAQYRIFNVQSSGNVQVGNFSDNTFTLNSTAILFSTGERINPSYPFINCASVKSCTDCTTVTKCSWCSQSATCGLTSAGAGISHTARSPPECISSSMPNYCIYPANLTIWTPQKPRCDAVNNPNTPPSYLAPEQASACTSAFARERPCQELAQRFSCSVSCQQCGPNNSSTPLPVCKSVCDPLIASACPLTVAACNDGGSPFAFLCTPDSNPCTKTVINTKGLQEPATIPPSSAAPTPPTTPPLNTTTPVPSTPVPSNAPATPVPETPAVTSNTTAPVTTTEPTATTSDTTSESTTLTTSTTSTASTTSSTASTTTQTTTPKTTTTAAPTTSTTTSVSAPTTKGNRPVTLDPAIVAARLEEQKKNTTKLYEDENDVRIGVGIGIAAFVCCIILVVLCICNARA